MARDGLMERFELSRIQAQAILDLRLQRLTALQTNEIKTEHADVVERISGCATSSATRPRSGR